VEAVNHLKARSCLIDGEAVCCSTLRRPFALLKLDIPEPGRCFACVGGHVDVFLIKGRIAERLRQR
jgi:hypothetical protein